MKAGTVRIVAAGSVKAGRTITLEYGGIRETAIAATPELARAECLRMLGVPISKIVPAQTSTPAALPAADRDPGRARLRDPRATSRVEAVIT